MSDPHHRVYTFYPPRPERGVRIVVVGTGGNGGWLLDGLAGLLLDLAECRQAGVAFRENALAPYPVELALVAPDVVEHRNLARQNFWLADVGRPKARALSDRYRGALGLESEVDVLIGTLSKALGSYGAFACCAPTIADFLINRARTLIYSTALPPPSVAAALRAIGLLRDDPRVVERLRQNARVLRGELAASGFDLRPDAMPIVPLVLGDPGTALAASEEALRQGVFVQAMRPPTVPSGTSRLRAVATAAHSESELRSAGRALAAACAQIPSAAAGTP